LSASVLRSSGYPQADQAALTAVRAAAPFRPLPPNYSDDDATIQFTFDYTVMGADNASGYLR
jgi:TonB family protein